MGWVQMRETTSLAKCGISLLLFGDEALAEGEDGGLGAVANAELLKDDGQVVFDRLFGVDQLSGDFSVAHAGGHVTHDFYLSGSEVARGWVEGRSIGGQVGQAAILADKRARYLRLDQHTALM